MQTITLKLKCSSCGGDGFYPTYSGGEIASQEPCEWPGCVDGYIEVGQFAIDPGLDDIIDKCNDILGKCDDILEEITS